MLTIYHASSERVPRPDIYHSRQYLDFGPGFYATPIIQQAINYASRFTRRGLAAWLNTYNAKDDFSQYKVLTFDNYNEGWLDYVTECRAGHVTDDYDVVIGGVANDKVFRTIDLYFANLINKDEALNRLKYEKPNNQYCFRTQAVIDECITFINAREL